jgi:hypothetical protein
MINSWKGHSNHFIVDNKHEGGFDAKMKKSMDCILKVIGLPESAAYYKQFLLKSNSDGEYIFDSSMESEVFEVETTVLLP